MLIYSSFQGSGGGQDSFGDGFVGDGFAVTGDNIQKRLREKATIQSFEELTGFSADTRPVHRRRELLPQKKRQGLKTT
jgi:hypothetical protein